MRPPPRDAGCSIGPATPDDLAAVTALLTTDRLPAEGLAAHVDTCLVARDGDVIVGAAAVEVYGPAGLLRSVVVAAAYRRAGLARRLTTAALELARHHRVRIIYLVARTAAEFFPSLGFTLVPRGDVELAVRQSAAGGDHDDAVVMQLVLD